AKLGLARGPEDFQKAVAFADVVVLGLRVNQRAVFVQHVLARKAAFSFQRNQANAAALRERTSPVAVLADFAGDVDDRLPAGKPRRFVIALQLEIADELHSGGFVALADESGRVLATDFGRPLASKQFLVRWGRHFRANVEAAGSHGRLSPRLA